MDRSLERARRTRALLIALAFAAVTAGAVAVAVAAPTAAHGSAQAHAVAPPRIGDAHIGSDDAGATLSAWTRGNSIEASLQPAGQRAWGPPQVLVQMSFPVGYWSSAVGRDGLALLVWERRIGATSTIWARTARLPATTWSPAVRISGPAGVGVRAVVQAAVAPDGRAVAVWRERHGPSYVLLGTARVAGATAWTAPSQSLGSACPGAFIPELTAGGGAATASWVCFERNRTTRLRSAKITLAGALARTFTIAN